MNLIMRKAVLKRGTEQGAGVSFTEEKMVKPVRVFRNTTMKDGLPANNVALYEIFTSFHRQTAILEKASRQI